MTAETIDSGTQTPSVLMEQQILDGAQAPYTFPTQKLKRRMTQPGKTPLVLVACGSFSRTY
jgi:nicotinamide mononucleotide adenylyltransferase